MPNTLKIRQTRDDGGMTDEKRARFRDIMSLLLYIYVCMYKLNQICKTTQTTTQIFPSDMCCRNQSAKTLAKTTVAPLNIIVGIKSVCGPFGVCTV